MSSNSFTFADQLDSRMGWRNHADPVIEGKLYLGKYVRKCIIAPHMLI